MTDALQVVSGDIQQRITFMWMNDVTLESAEFDNLPYVFCDNISYQTFPGASTASVTVLDPYNTDGFSSTSAAGTGTWNSFDDLAVPANISDLLERIENVWCVIEDKKSGAYQIRFVGKVYNSLLINNQNMKGWNLKLTDLSGFMSQQRIETHRYRYPIPGAGFYGTSNVRHMESFNIPRQGFVVGNHYEDGGLHYFTDPISLVGSDEATQWDGDSIVDYLLERVESNLLPSSIQLSYSDSAGLDAIKDELFSIKRKTYFGLLKEIISRKRGLTAWWEYSGTATNITATLHIGTYVGNSVADKIGKFNRNTRVISSWSAESSANVFDTVYKMEPKIETDGTQLARFVEVRTQPCTVIGTWACSPSPSANGLVPYWGDAELPDDYNATLDRNIATDYIYSTFALNPYENYEPENTPSPLSFSLPLSGAAVSGGELEYGSIYTPGSAIRFLGSIPLEINGNLTDIAATDPWVFDKEGTTGEIMRSKRNTVPIAVFLGDDAEPATVPCGIRAVGEAVQIQVSSDFGGQTYFKDELNRQDLRVTAAIDGITPIVSTVDSGISGQSADNSIQSLDVNIKPIILLPNTKVIIKDPLSGLPVARSLDTGTDKPLMIQRFAGELKDIMESYVGYYKLPKRATQWSIYFHEDAKYWKLGYVVERIATKQWLDGETLHQEMEEINSLITNIVLDYRSGTLSYSTGFAESLE